jgi:hypothetical protein
MDRFEGRCWLDWWANSSTLLGSVEIAVVVTASGSGWAGQGKLVSEDDDDREGFVFLCELDPVFTMRFDGEGTVPVAVHDLREDGRRFSLAEYREPQDRSIIGSSCSRRLPETSSGTARRHELAAATCDCLIMTPGNHCDPRWA